MDPGASLAARPNFRSILRAAFPMGTISGSRLWPQAGPPMPWHCPSTANGNLPASRYRRWFNPHKRARVFSRQHIQEAIGSLTHVSYALLQLAKHRLAVELLPLVIEIDPLQMAGSRNFALAHAAHEHVIFPVWELVAGIKCHA